MNSIKRAAGSRSGATMSATTTVRTRGSRICARTAPAASRSAMATTPIIHRSTRASRTNSSGSRATRCARQRVRAGHLPGYRAALNRRASRLRNRPRNPCRRRPPTRPRCMACRACRRTRSTTWRRPPPLRPIRRPASLIPRSGPTSRTWSTPISMSTRRGRRSKYNSPATTRPGSAISRSTRSACRRRRCSRCCCRRRRPTRSSSKATTRR